MTHTRENRNSIEVANSLVTLSTPWSRLLWGPPGAGKTYALGHLITKLLKEEPSGRILIVAPSNRAVDVAVEQLLIQIENTELLRLLEQRKILRFGYPRRTRILELPEILSRTIWIGSTIRLRAYQKEVQKARRNWGFG